MHVDQIGLRVKVQVPDIFEQHRARDHLADAAHQVLEQLELLGGQIDSQTAASPRLSNGLKEFLWLASDTNRGTILDLGPAWQATLTFFAEKGYRITSDDLLRTWWAFLTGEEERLRSLGIQIDRVFPDPERRLYDLLAIEGEDEAHGRYNALVRRLVSFERALECASP